MPFEKLRSPYFCHFLHSEPSFSPILMFLLLDVNKEITTKDNQYANKLNNNSTNYKNTFYKVILKYPHLLEISKFGA